jgi:iron complex outermembrane receptor protein
MRLFFRAGIASACLLVPQQLAAQQASGADANDAFGRLVGLESIGLYDEGQVRGFNLENAGNYRIEGHYFARAISPFFLLREATTVRIGVNALRYDFPAPSGVIEFDLRRVPEGSSVTVESGRRAYNGPFVDIVGSTRRPGGNLGVLVATELAPWQRYANGASGEIYAIGSVVRWEPAPSVNIAAFGNFTNWKADPDTGFLPSGEFLPPRVKRGDLRSQSWAEYREERRNLGLFGDAGLGSNWKLSGGIFYSADRLPRYDFNLLEIKNPAGDYHAQTFVSPPQSVASKSGSLFLEHEWTSGPLTHRIVGTVRARDTLNRNTPTFQFDIGDSNLGLPLPQIPRPDFTISDEKSVDRTRQLTLGAGYRVGIGRSVELRGDVQKTDYSRTHRDADGTVSHGSSRPWLYSASALVGVTRKLVVFGSYSRGLEESGIAPVSSVNRGQVLPAVLATQREIGARYSFGSALSLIAGAFDTRKATPGTGPDGRYDLVGEVRHRGLEASLAGALTPRLNVVAGLMILDATLSGPLIDARVIGRHPVATPDHVALVNVNWQPQGLKGLTLDATLNQLGRAYISSSNVTKSDLQTTVDVGARYNFAVGRVPLSIRARVLNLTNRFYWQPGSSGTLYPSNPRDFDLSVSATF